MLQKLFPLLGATTPGIPIGSMQLLGEKRTDTSSKA